MNEESKSPYEKKRENFKGFKLFFSILLLLVWFGALTIGFLVWLKGLWVGQDFIYHPQIGPPNLREFSSYLYSVSLFAITGGVIAQVYSIFRKIWEIEVSFDDQLKTAKERIKCIEERLREVKGQIEKARERKNEDVRNNEKKHLLKQKNNLEDEKLNLEEKCKLFVSRKLDFLNSSSTNVLCFRPFFFPLVGGVLTVIVVLALYDFNINLPRLMVVSILLGVAIGQSPIKLKNRIVGSISNFFS